MNARRIASLGVSALCAICAVFCLYQGGVLQVPAKPTFALAAEVRLALPAPAHEGMLSLETATADALAKLPGIGPGIAAGIVAYRDARGEFVNVEELARVPGIGDATMKKLRPLVCVCETAHGDVLSAVTATTTPTAAPEKATPMDVPTNDNAILVSINTAGIDELMTLPGIGEKLAQAILDEREKRGRFETIDDLREVPGIGEKRLEALRDFLLTDEQGQLP